jgi:hypothetical protein
MSRLLSLICKFKLHRWIYLYKSSSKIAIEDRVCDRCHISEYFSVVTREWVKETVLPDVYYKEKFG